MKLLFAFFTGMFLTFSAAAQTGKSTIHQPNSTQPIQTVEAACGMCQFGMKADDCKLAVRINGIAYHAEGTSINEHGDAHAKDGFCNTIRKAEVQGTVKDEKFVVTYFKLVDNKPAKKKNKKG